MRLVGQQNKVATCLIKRHYWHIFSYILFRINHLFIFSDPGPVGQAPMSEKKKEALEDQARSLKEHVLFQTQSLSDEEKCKVWEDTIFMLQHHVNSIKPTL